MEDDNEDNLKNKEDLHIAGRHTALDIFRFAVFFCHKKFNVWGPKYKKYCKAEDVQRRVPSSNVQVLFVFEVVLIVIFH